MLLAHCRRKTGWHVVKRNTGGLMSAHPNTRKLTVQCRLIATEVRSRRLNVGSSQDKDRRLNIGSRSLRAKPAGYILMRLIYTKVDRRSPTKAAH
ncbi:hypothetical protein M8J75_008604 [Diaphorina citri]|nr:hypothetical protein M8J75_008604 [Diaphorina citri]